MNRRPMPAYESFDLESYFPRGNPVTAYVESGRGCKGACTFCCEATLWGRACRRRTTDDILREVGILQRLGVNHFFFTQDDFLGDDGFAEDFTNAIRSHQHPFTWGCFARSEGINRHLLEMLGCSGMTRLYLGIESGCLSRQRIIGKRLDLNHALDVIDICVGMKIRATISFIVGFPGETDDELEQTISFALRCRDRGADDVQLERCMLIPGSPLYNNHSRSGSIRPVSDASYYLDVNIFTRPSRERREDLPLPLTPSRITIRNDDEEERLFWRQQASVIALDFFPATVSQLTIDRGCVLLEVIDELTAVIRRSIDIPSRLNSAVLTVRDTLSSIVGKRSGSESRHLRACFAYERRVAALRLTRYRKTSHGPIDWSKPVVMNRGVDVAIFPNASSPHRLIAIDSERYLICEIPPGLYAILSSIRRKSRRMDRAYFKKMEKMLGGISAAAIRRNISDFRLAHNPERR